jgi:hypothetical protein
MATLPASHQSQSPVRAGCLTLARLIIERCNRAWNIRSGPHRRPFRAAAESKQIQPRAYRETLQLQGPGGAKPWVLASLRRFSMGGGVFSRLPRTGYSVEPLATSRGVRAHGRRDRRVLSHDHARANGRCRGPRGPNGLRAFASLRDSGRNAGASSMPLQTEDAPNVPGPTCSGDPPGSNIPQSKRSPCLEGAQRLHKRPLEAGFRCTPKFALNSACQ